MKILNGFVTEGFGKSNVTKSTPSAKRTPVFISPALAAAYFEVDETIIDQWVDEGKLPYHRSPQLCFDVCELMALKAMPRPLHIEITDSSHSDGKSFSSYPNSAA